VSGVLLDTHALVWLMAGETMTDAAFDAIIAAQTIGRLHISPISAWEAAVAVRKPDPARRPKLGGQEAAAWFGQALALTGARLASVTRRVAVEAARIPDVYGRGDPGDCFLIATARAMRVPMVTRDGAMCALADGRPDYLSVIPC
jgi:PIN domain nuclease of toxin-antitoxin system